ncbi:hypothetical protein ACR9GP_24270 [Enterobacter ludwigii]
MSAGWGARGACCYFEDEQMHNVFISLHQETASDLQEAILTQNI